MKGFNRNRETRLRTSNKQYGRRDEAEKTVKRACSTQIPLTGTGAERNNHVVIDPVDLSHGDLLKSFVFEHLDPLRPSTEMGANIYTEALELVFQRLEQLVDSGIYMPQ